MTEANTSLIEALIKQEWFLFDQVKNIGGRADCQDQWDTFHLMRSAYYQAWSLEMLESYQQDLKQAQEEKRNLVTEKYAYMMEYTDPAYYQTNLAPYLPELSRSKAVLIDEIVTRMMAYDKEFAAHYPKLNARKRPADAASDSASVTSAETYARGELRTYSEETLQRLLQWFDELDREGKNFTWLVEDSTVRLYGYSSLEEVEERL